MVERVFAILVNLSWQLVLIFGMAWLSLAMFRIRSSSAKHVVWLAVVLCPIALVPMNIVPLEIALLPAGSFETTETTDNSFGLSAQVDKTLLDRPIILQPEVEISSEHQFFKNVWFKLPLLSICIWAAGVGVGFIRIAAGYLMLKKLILRARKVEKEKIHRIFNQIKVEIGISRRVRLLISNEVRIPCSIGFIHPCVILPHNTFLSDEKLRMVLIHELVHLNRFDDLVNLLSQIIGALMFFHPIFHRVVKELELSSEEICDGWVIRSTEAKEDYVDCLVEFAGINMGRFPIGFCNRQSSIVRRVEFILKTKGGFKIMSKKSRAFLSLLASICILIISVIKLVGCTSDVPPGFTLKGTVKDAITGRPIAGARVSDGKYGSEPHKGATTDADGKYSYLTWYEEHNIIAQAPGYKTQRQTLMTKFLGEEKEKVMDFALAPE
jgi:beta-lactamase regulating signal transducer with metallopeptidase domain